MELNDVLRIPRLDTVIMVEQFIKENDGMFRKRKLWESLPKKMMYQTFCVIIDYLIYSNKIFIDTDGKIEWLSHPRLAKEKPRKEFKHFFIHQDSTLFS